MYVEGNTCGESWRPETDAISASASFLTRGQVPPAYRYRLRVPSCGFASRKRDAMGLMLFSVPYSPLPFASAAQRFSSSATATPLALRLCPEHRQFRQDREQIR